LHLSLPDLTNNIISSTSVDIWSAGCIFVEFFMRDSLFKADNEAQQLRIIFELLLFLLNFHKIYSKICRKLGTPKACLWPAEAVVSHANYPEYKAPPLYTFAPRMPQPALELLASILNFNPHQRPTAAECLLHPYFN
jgi:serine/threonine protein kinase